MAKKVTVKITRPVSGLYNRKTFPAIGETMEMNEADVSNFERIGLVERVETPEQRTKPQETAAVSGAETPETKTKPRATRRRAKDSE